MIEASTIIETLKLIAPLGVRFWDTATRKTVSDGLIVTAYPLHTPRRRTRAFRNLTGTYVLRNLPGLRGFEYGQGEESQRHFAIEVVDSENRFVPFFFTCPVPQYGIYSWDDPLESSPPYPLLGVPLHSAATRLVPGPMAVLRAELWDPYAGLNHDGGPAAWAVIEAGLPDQSIVRGIADANGRIVLIFPYPDPIPDAFSPPVRLQQRTWSIRLRAAYEPLDPAPPLRDLLDILTQPAATLWADAAMETVLTEVALRFGQESFLKSEDHLESTLLITPVGSPP